jgi:hypothetical protein
VDHDGPTLYWCTREAGAKHDIARSSIVLRWWPRSDSAWGSPPTFCLVKCNGQLDVAAERRRRMKGDVFQEFRLQRRSAGSAGLLLAS